ncbi:MAG TPA: gamma-glutamyl-gamma-aminobutyrate hydrolase family protein [Vicinamibacterales bacterium]|nr:gamma-glutamyl-gamma-aminobutyrate hydrolase family protein [Vicinamibacterales bacterium]
MAVIGIAACARLHDYEESVRRAGGEPRVLPIGMPVEQALEGLDGLMLAGGEDVDPRFFNEPPHPTFRPAEPGRDEHETALVRAAVNAGLPVLAICRGAQVLNVAFGGSLVQDIPSLVPNAANHNIESPPSAIAHEVWMTRDSLLWTLMREATEGEDTVQVNSRHHQAVARPGEGLVICGTAPDGVVEAIERPGGSFCLGVQWHPENFWRTGEFRPLFEGFVRAAEARASSR